MSKQEYSPEITKEQLLEIKPGYIIERMLAFCIPCYLIVQSVDGDIIDAGWTFSRTTGLEIDEEIPSTVSYIKRAWATKEEADKYIKTKPL